MLFFKRFIRFIVSHYDFIQNILYVYFMSYVCMHAWMLCLGFQTVLDLAG